MSWFSCTKPIPLVIILVWPPHPKNRIFLENTSDINIINWSKIISSNHDTHASNRTQKINKQNLCVYIFSLHPAATPSTTIDSTRIYSDEMDLSPTTPGMKNASCWDILHCCLLWGRVRFFMSFYFQTTMRTRRRRDWREETASHTSFLGWGKRSSLVDMWPQWRNKWFVAKQLRTWTQMFWCSM